MGEDVAILVCALSVIVTIVIKMVAESYVTKLRQTVSNLEGNRLKVMDGVQEIQRRRTSAVGSRDFMKRRKEEAATRITELNTELQTLQGVKPEEGAEKAALELAEGAEEEGVVEATEEEGVAEATEEEATEEEATEEEATEEEGVAGGAEEEGIEEATEEEATEEEGIEEATEEKATEEEGIEEEGIEEEGNEDFDEGDLDGEDGTLKGGNGDDWDIEEDEDEEWNEDEDEVEDEEWNEDLEEKIKAQQKD